MEKILFTSFVISFLVTLFAIPYWIKRAKRAGLVGKDMHKLKKKDVAEMGGIVVVLGFILGVLFYIGVRTFHFKDTDFTINIFAIFSTVLIITIIGLIDDILGWKMGLRQWQKPFLTLFAALPIMAVNAGHTSMMLPFLGRVEFGFIYPLIIIPIIIVGASNGFNMIAGYNGLEAGMGIIILSTLSFITWYKQGTGWLAVVGLCMVFSLVAFFIYNKNPAKVFPGDTLTYPVGALIACLAIIGNIETAALILFIPYFLELILKLRGKLQKESFAKLNDKGYLIRPYGKIYGLEHLMIYLLGKTKKNVTENNVVYSLLLIEVALASFVLVVL